MLFGSGCFSCCSICIKKLVHVNTFHVFFSHMFKPLVDVWCFSLDICLSNLLNLLLLKQTIKILLFLKEICSHFFPVGESKQICLLCNNNFFQKGKLQRSLEVELNYFQNILCITIWKGAHASVCTDGGAGYRIRITWEAC